MKRTALYTPGKKKVKVKVKSALDEVATPMELSTVSVALSD